MPGREGGQPGSRRNNVSLGWPESESWIWQMADMALKRYGETKEDFLAARATPFDNLQKEEIATAAAL